MIGVWGTHKTFSKSRKILWAVFRNNIWQKGGKQNGIKTRVSSSVQRT